MRVLVTGASGFVGGYLVEDLVRRGHGVVAMARQGSDTSRLDRLGVEVRRADLTSPTSLRGAVEGMDAVVHLAAYYTLTGRKGTYERVNVQGTRDLLEAMAEKGVRRMVYCSSTEAMGPTDGCADESSPCRPTNEYGRSKLRAEEVVRGYSSKGVESVILRPSGIYGPGNVDDVSFWFVTSFANNPAARIIVGDGRRRLMFVHVEDVVQGFRLALERFESAKGRTFFITDSQAYDYDQIYSILASACGVPVPRRHMPLPLARVVLSPVHLVNWIRRSPNFIWRAGNMSTFKQDRCYSIESARSALGYSPAHGLAEGLRETADWCRQNGHIGG